MIKSFRSRETAHIFAYERSRRFGSIERIALRKLLQMHAATELAVLASPPGNHLEALRGARRPTLDPHQRSMAHMLCLAKR